MSDQTSASTPSGLQSSKIAADWLASGMRRGLVVILLLAYVLAVIVVNIRNDRQAAALLSPSAPESANTRDGAPVEGALNLQAQSSQPSALAAEDQNDQTETPKAQPGTTSQQLSLRIEAHSTTNAPGEDASDVDTTDQVLSIDGQPIDIPRTGRIHTEFGDDTSETDVRLRIRGNANITINTND